MVVVVFELVNVVNLKEEEEKGDGGEVEEMEFWGEMAGARAQPWKARRHGWRRS